MAKKKKKLIQRYFYRMGGDKEKRELNVSGVLFVAETVLRNLYFDSVCVCVYVCVCDKSMICGQYSFTLSILM